MINIVVKALLKEEPLFGYMIQNSKIILDKKGEFVNTACVTIDASGTLVFYINPEYFLNFSHNINVLIKHVNIHDTLNQLFH